MTSTYVQITFELDDSRPNLAKALADPNAHWAIQATFRGEHGYFQKDLFGARRVGDNLDDRKALIRKIAGVDDETAERLGF